MPGCAVSPVERRALKILFSHQNFPGQFKFLAPELLMGKVDLPAWRGVHLLPYSPACGSTPGVHSWISNFEAKTLRGEACFRATLTIKAQGYELDLIIAHAARGESLFIEDVWPRAKFGIYCEFFYRAEGADVGFDPEFGAPDEGTACCLQLKNLHYLPHFETADAGLAPTEWQADGFPSSFRPKISVIHDGIDTAAVAPDPAARFTSSNGLALTRTDEVVTYMNRHLEPYCGYHIFMRMLPQLLKARPKESVLIVGGDDVSYGARAGRPVLERHLRRRGATGNCRCRLDPSALSGEPAIPAVRRPVAVIDCPCLPDVSVRFVVELAGGDERGVRPSWRVTPHQCTRWCGMTKQGVCWIFSMQMRWQALAQSRSIA